MNGKHLAETLRQLDIVFVIDTTGSMGSCIRQVQMKLGSFAQTIAEAAIQPDVAFGVVAYRDHPPQDKSYVTRVYPISPNLRATQAVINELNADGGGDEPEAVMDGLWDALHKSEWRSGAHKAIILVGDAPAHEQCPNELTFDTIIQNARRLQTAIFAVGTSRQPQMIRQFKVLADSTGGLFILLDDIGLLIEKILSLLQQTVMVDMEVSLAVYNRRMKGISPAEIARQIGRKESEVRLVIQTLEKKGAKWPTTTDSKSERAGTSSGRVTTGAPSPVLGSVPIGPPQDSRHTLPGKPIIVPISNLTAQETYQVRWMGWQGTAAYELQEASTPTFTDAKVVYTGTDTSWSAHHKSAGTYFYRVRLSDGAGNYSAWSDVQSTVVS